MSNKEPEVQLTQHFDAPREIVFDAWLDPGMVKRWLFANENNEILQVQIDPKAGGQFSILELIDGKKIDHFGKYKVITRPSLLAFTLEVPMHFEGVTDVTISLEPRDQGCELFFTQRGIPPEKTEANWRDMFQHLNQVLNGSWKVENGK